MQGEIFMAKSVGCILIVWTTKSMVDIQIEANDDWKNNIDILLDFFINSMYIGC